MRISFNGIYLYKYPDKAMRSRAKSLENCSSNGHGIFWKAININTDKNSSDMLILTGLDLETAIENMAEDQTVDEYVRENKDKYIQKAEIRDYR